jgi:hypothetical protein
VLPPIRLAVVIFAACLAIFVGAARADTPAPATFNAHGVTFTYPGDWIELPVTYQVMIGTPLWLESLGPAPSLPPTTGTPPPSGTQPTPTALNIATLAAYHVGVALTKKNIGRYKKYFAASFAQMVAEVHGQVESGPTRVNVGKLPGYGFRFSAPAPDGTALEDHVVFVFKQKTEYFFACQHPQDDASAAEIESGCDQIMQSFRLTK